MKILHVIANLAPRYGGPSKACVEMAAATAKLGHEVSIYTTNQDGPGELDVTVTEPVYKDGVEIHYFPSQTPRFWGTSFPLASELNQRIPKVDIVHVHSLYLFHNLVTGYYCRKYNIPYLIRPHGTLDPYLFRRHRGRKKIMESLFENKNIRGAAAIHFTTEEEKTLASPYVFGRPSVVVPLGLDLNDYTNLPEPRLFGARYPELKKKKIVLFFGRLNFKKGLDILAKAFALVAKGRDGVHLVIAGPDNDGYQSHVKGWLKDEGVLDKVTFTGLLQGDDKLAVLQAADVFVLPSYTENFGISVIEAMACALPVVISDKVNIWREVKNSKAGRVSPCDSNSFAEMILEVLADPQKAETMGHCGRQLVEERFQWDSVALKMQDVYSSILSDRLLS